MTNSDHGPQPAPQKDPPQSESTALAVSAYLWSVRRYIGTAGSVIAAIGVAYFWSMGSLIEVWEENPNYSHGYVVPFFALGLGWVAFTRSNVLPISDQVSRKDTIRGGIEIAVGFGLHLFGMYTGIDIFDVVGLIFILLGVLLIFGGEQANRVYALPVFFLIFMAPLPAPVYDPVAKVLQHFASIVAVSLFDTVGVSALRDGIIISLEGGHVMKVEGACSGLRSLTAILALAVAIGYLSGRKMPYCILLVLMAAPVAITVNCVRVFGTGLIMVYINPQLATGDAHKAEGMVMVGVAAAILALLAWIMSSMEDWYQERSEKSAKPSPSKMQPAVENN